MIRDADKEARLKCKYSISVEDVNELLFQKVAHKENIIPKTITEIDRVTKDLLVQHEEHVICACEEYRFTADRQTCEICNQDRSVGTNWSKTSAAQRGEIVGQTNSSDGGHYRKVTLCSRPARIVKLGYLQPGDGEECHSSFLLFRWFQSFPPHPQSIMD
ncbi:Hypothetical predicted protein [Mytilus galloprovincialis]|uniref:Uncharacterized protein n=1 Tax=Mytilus galloprovincialis TaxID=29158 RepID=A0A8B6HT43_MYTGA|nr:Hypothetical predicted protein [Mytilus galloprovincialis]